MPSGLNVCRRKGLVHGPTDFRVGGGPDFDFLLATLVVSDDASLELSFGLFGFLLVAVEDLRLLRRQHDVGNRHRHTGLSCVAEANVLHVVERLSNSNAWVTEQQAAR